MTDAPSERLRKAGLTLPPAPTPKGSYAPVVRSGRLAWVSGQIVFEEGAVVRPGTVDREVPAAVASDLVRRATLQALSALAAELGGLDSVRRVVRLGVFVAVSPGFHREHEVANGGSDLLLELFGEAGRASRSTIGVAGLPLNAPVEVELLVETA
ncbi:MAG TPA: RidA family protein [Thermoplasmata archaeon]|nr:RidA family protein [Thermoplasmata archaeon]